MEGVISFLMFGGVEVSVGRTFEVRVSLIV